MLIRFQKAKRMAISQHVLPPNIYLPGSTRKPTAEKQVTFKEKRIKIYMPLSTECAAAFPSLRYPSLYVYIIDQARGQDGWILTEFSFCVFMDRAEVEVRKKRTRPISSHLDRTSLVNKRFIVWHKER